MKGRSGPNPPPPRRVPAQPRRQLLRVRGIENGEEILERQMTPRAAGMRPLQHGPEHAGKYGGGTSPVATDHTIHPHDFGKVAVWESDGRIAISPVPFVAEAPTDGQEYARQNGMWVVVGGSVGAIGEAPNDGRNYTRNGLTAAWEPLPYIIPEAPTDGQAYARIGLNNEWTAVFTEAQALALFAPISTASFPEAPQDGQVYARRGWDHSWIPVLSEIDLLDLEAKLANVPIVFMTSARPAAGAIVANVPVTIPLTVPASLTGTQAYAVAAATNAAVFVLQKQPGNVALGTVTFTAGSQTAVTLEGAGGSLAPGDTLQMVAPAVQDATLANFGVTILTQRV